MRARQFGRYASAGLCIALFSVASTRAQQRTLAVYGDWTVSCALSSGSKSCGLVQAQKVNGQSGPASQIGIGRNSKADSFKMSIEVSANAWIPTGVKLFTNGNTLALTAQFKWCVSTRCLAEVELTDPEINSLRGQQENGRLVSRMHLRPRFRFRLDSEDLARRSMH